MRNIAKLLYNATFPTNVDLKTHFQQQMKKMKMKQQQQQRVEEQGTLRSNGKTNSNTKPTTSSRIKGGGGGGGGGGGTASRSSSSRNGHNNSDNTNTDNNDKDRNNRRMKRDDEEDENNNNWIDDGINNVGLGAVPGGLTQPEFFEFGWRAGILTNQAFGGADTFVDWFTDGWNAEYYTYDNVLDTAVVGSKGANYEQVYLALRPLQDFFELWASVDFYQILNQIPVQILETGCYMHGGHKLAVDQLLLEATDYEGLNALQRAMELHNRCLTANLLTPFNCHLIMSTASAGDGSGVTMTMYANNYFDLYPLDAIKYPAAAAVDATFEKGINPHYYSFGGMPSVSIETLDECFAIINDFDRVYNFMNNAGPFSDPVPLYYRYFGFAENYRQPGHYILIPTTRDDAVAVLQDVSPLGDYWATSNPALQLFLHAPGLYRDHLKVIFELYGINSQVRMNGYPSGTWCPGAYFQFDEVCFSGNCKIDGTCA